MAGETKATTDHRLIKKWVEQRGGRPATVRRTGGTSDPGLLRIDFPGYSGKQSLEQIPWEEFFKKFDEKKLLFLFQDRMRNGQESRFFKFISHATADDEDVDHRHERSTHAESARHDGDKDKGKQRSAHSRSEKQ